MKKQYVVILPLYTRRKTDFQFLTTDHDNSNSECDQAVFTDINVCIQFAKRVQSENADCGVYDVLQIMEKF